MSKLNTSLLSYIKKIETFDKDSVSNGCVLTIINQNEPNTEKIDQVYITVCEPNKIKGPHMHYHNKIDRFYCIEGKVAVICRNEKTQAMCEYILEAFDNQLLSIDPYNSHAIVALGGKKASILSMPNEGYCSNENYNQIEVEYKNYNWGKWL